MVIQKFCSVNSCIKFQFKLQEAMCVMKDAYGFLLSLGVKDRHQKRDKHILIRKRIKRRE